VDGRNPVDDIAQEATALHAIVHAFEDGGNHVSAIVPVRNRKRPEITKEASALRAIRTGRLLVVNECQQFVAGDAVRFGRPIPPTVGWFGGRPEFLAGKLDLLLSR
jgi:hypothetical protein